MYVRAVHVPYLKRQKALNPADSHHGGFQGASIVYDFSQHVTAMIIAIASGILSPPFLIIEAMRYNERWVSPVTGSFDGSVSGICAKYTKPNGMRQQAEMKVSDNGSMENPILARL